MGLQTAEGCDQRHSLGKAKPAFFQAVTDALDSSSVSNAYAWGRRLIQEYTRFFRERAPGCEEIELAATASLMGVRESIRILGEYDLTWDDFRVRRKFHDQIGIYCKQVDIHVYDTR